MAKITMQEIAEIAGVSKTADSYAFNYPERISKDTLQKILKIAEELDFIPDPIARSMSTGIIGIIGVLVPHPLPEMLANPAFTIVLEGLGEALKEDKTSLMLVPPLEGSLTRAVANASVDAFVAYDLKESRNVAQILQARRIPFVTVDTDPIEDISGVLADDISSAEQMMNLVLSKGHKNIAIMALEPLEAMAQGQLFVASDVGGHKELVEHNKTGILFKAGDRDSLTQALLNLLNDRYRWPELKANGRQFVENIRNWQSSVANYRAPYQQLTGLQV